MIFYKASYHSQCSKKLSRVSFHLLIVLALFCNIEKTTDTVTSNKYQYPKYFVFCILPDGIMKVFLGLEHEPLQTDGYKSDRGTGRHIM